jgi:hypothetical protein
MDAAIFEDDERVDLEVSKVKICIYVVESDDKVDEGIFSLSGEGRADERLDVCTGREAIWVNRNLQTGCVCVDIADIDTTGGGEEDCVGETGGSDADVRLCGLGVGQEGLDDKRVERARDGFNLQVMREYVKG